MRELKSPIHSPSSVAAWNKQLWFSRTDTKVLVKNILLGDTNRLRSFLSREIKDSDSGTLTHTGGALLFITNLTTCHALII